VVVIEKSRHNGVITRIGGISSVHCIGTEYDLL
jgi:hypothetical protein